jgi:hypothetical protein
MFQLGMQLDQLKLTHQDNRSLHLAVMVNIWWQYRKHQQLLSMNNNTQSDMFYMRMHPINLSTEEELESYKVT